MSRKSARILGESLGMTAKEVNKELEKLGYIEKSKAVTQTGSPTWDLTEEGKKHGEPSKHPYSSGAIWDDEVANKLRESDTYVAHEKEVKEIRKKMGLD